MRRKQLAIFLTIPMANAFTLGNFQGITSAVVPISCQLAYNAPILSCVRSDFDNGCSPACVSALNSLASNIQSSCEGVTVSSQTLLGIVMHGGIIQALCPTLARTTERPQATQPVPAISVTIPTDSRGVTGGLGFRTTTTQQRPTPTPQRSSATNSLESTSTSDIVQSALPEQTVTVFPTQSANGGIGGVAPAASTNTRETNAASQTAKPKSGTGGGSPFDVLSSANRVRSSFICGVFVVVACALQLR